MARIYVVLSILLTVLGSVFDPNSILGYSAKETHAPSIMLWGAMAVCIISLADVIINDFMSNKYYLGCTSKYRHLFYMSLALISISLSMGIVTAHYAPFLVGRLWLDGIVATVVAFLDIFVRRGCIGSSLHIQSD